MLRQVGSDAAREDTERADARSEAGGRRCAGGQNIPERTLLPPSPSGDQTGAGARDQALLPLSQHDLTRQEAAPRPVDRAVPRPPARR